MKGSGKSSIKAGLQMRTEWRGVIPGYLPGNSQPALYIIMERAFRIQMNVNMIDFLYIHFVEYTILNVGLS